MGRYNMLHILPCTTLYQVHHSYFRHTVNVALLSSPLAFYPMFCIGTNEAGLITQSYIVMHNMTVIAHYVIHTK